MRLSFPFTYKEEAMKCSIVHLGLVIALAWSLSSMLQGEQLKEGTWSGSWVSVGGSNPNPRPRSVSIEVKKGPDPHWRWRLGQGELWSATIVADRRVRSHSRCWCGTWSASSPTPCFPGTRSTQNALQG